MALFCDEYNLDSEEQRCDQTSPEVCATGRGL